MLEDKKKMLGEKHESLDENKMLRELLKSALDENKVQQIKTEKK